jgi:hypothetical protein
MRANTPKRRAYNLAASKVSTALIRELGYCEACGHSPRNPWRDKPVQCSVLTPQEIGRGKYRKDCQGKRFAILCACWFCNTEELTKASIWPVERQLCLLKHSRPQDFDLKAFVSLLRPHAPNWITEADVSHWDEEIGGLVFDTRLLRMGA